MKSNPLLNSIRGGLTLAALVLLSASPAGAAAGPKAYRFTATVGNISGSTLVIDHPAFNGKPTVKPVLTQFWDDIYNAHPVGFRYNRETSKWVIENEDGVAMPTGAKFNILLAPATKQLLCTPANTFENRSFSLVQKGNENALLLASHVINPVKGMPGIKLQSYFGTYFEGPSSNPFGAKWSIYNEAGEAGPNLGPVGLNIVDVTKLKVAKAPASFRFIAAPATVVGNEAIITNPLTDGKPDAAVFVQHVFGPEKGTNVYLNKAVGVYYAGAKWRIFIQDESDMPANAAFAVAVIPAITP